MRILSLLAHPRPESLCHAISARARQTLADLGCEVRHHDLYAEGFDPCLTADEAYAIGYTYDQTMALARDPVLLAHRADLAASAGLLVVHPNWWGKPPAILSGWLDRVLIPGVAYRQARGAAPHGLLSLAGALILNTSDTPEDQEDAGAGDPLQRIWTRAVLPFCGVTATRRHMFRPVAGSTLGQRQGWLDQVAVMTRAQFAPQP